MHCWPLITFLSCVDLESTSNNPRNTTANRLPKPVLSSALQARSSALFLSSASRSLLSHMFTGSHPSSPRSPSVLVLSSPLRLCSPTSLFRIEILQRVRWRGTVFFEAALLLGFHFLLIL